MADMSTSQSVDTELSTSLLLEQFAERLKRRGIDKPGVKAVVFAARAEAFMNDLTSSTDQPAPD